jgi:uroporphyrinogen-III decarboxylase
MSKIIQEILELFKIDKVIISQGRKRQENIWLNREPDFIPIILNGIISERDKFPQYNMYEQFFKKEKMLIEQLWLALAMIRGESDSQISIRVNLGTGFIPTVFGLEETVTEDKMPWLKQHLTKEEILNFNLPKDISKSGLVPQAIEYINYYKNILPSEIHIYLPDIQGPLNIAHLIRGDEFFIDLYDDPEFVHKLMELSTQAYIKVSLLMKEIIGEPYDRGYHNSLYMAKGGVRMCEDTTTLLSPKIVGKFVCPYIAKALKPFDGGWLHFCGNANHILDMFLDIEEVKGINFGNPEMYDLKETLAKIRRKGKFYFGEYPRDKSETIEDYFQKVIETLNGEKRSLIFAPIIYESDPLERKAIVDLWHGLQERLL